MTVVYEGREQTLQQMAKYLELQDRGVRQEVWEKVFGWSPTSSNHLNHLFERQLQKFID